MIPALVIPAAAATESNVTAVIPSSSITWIAASRIMVFLLSRTIMRPSDWFSGFRRTPLPRCRARKRGAADWSERLH